MYGKILSCALVGIEGIPINVEADVSNGLPTFTMVGYLSSSVKEAGERVRTALKNSGYHLPPKRITINLSPGNIRKDGTSFDLPIAIAVLKAMGFFCDADFSNLVMIGEVGLDGAVKAVPGILPMVHSLYDRGIRQCVVPMQNKKEAMLVTGMHVIGVSDLGEIVRLLQSEKNIQEDNTGSIADDTEDVSEIDFSDIKGQNVLKRGMEIAAVGFHNVLMTGASGAGKSMLAKRLPTILPGLSLDEQMEVTKIYSVAGLLTSSSMLIRKRPFRSPHHTISEHALVGGGLVPKPGEISLAHRGVLFLDELPEFRKNVLEVLRQPMEEHRVSIARVNATYVFPAEFMLIAAMNPCPCGFFPDRERCVCTPYQIKRYQSKISGPLLDRIDINLEVQQVQYQELFQNDCLNTSKEIRSRVEAARDIQKMRYKEDKVMFNAQLTEAQIKKYVRLGIDEHRLLEDAFEKQRLSARGMYRVLRLARTIADMDASDKIQKKHLLEALYFKNCEVKRDVF